jgi:hypothetical protein
MVRRTFWGIIALERSCKAGAGLSILIQHLKIGSPTRIGAGVQAPGGSPQGRSLKALGGYPPRFINVGQYRGSVRPSGALLLIFLLIFQRHIVFRDLSGVNFSHVRVGCIFHSGDHLCLEGLPLFDQFFDALRPCLSHVRQSLCVAGLSGGCGARPLLSSGGGNCVGSDS